MSEKRDRRRTSDERRDYDERRSSDERRGFEARQTTDGRRRSKERRYADDETDRRQVRDRQAKDRRAGEHRKKKKKKWWKILLILFVTLTALCAIGCIAGMKFYEKQAGQTIFESYQEAMGIAKGSTSDDFMRGSKSYIYSSDGSELAELSLDNDSVYLTYQQIPDDVVNAFVAIEDRSFWTNSGIDVKGIARILVNYVASLGKKKTGASTITQQVVKLTYLTTDRTLSRKFKEIVIAREITKKYSKEDIITYYCNICCFANGIYGINDAAEAYFGKRPSELTLSETAYLCAIPNWPEKYNPYTNPDNALDRRDKILNDMCKDGYITQAECDAAKAEKMVIKSKTEDTDDYNYETTYAINCATKYIMDLQDFEFKYSFKSDSEYKEYQDAYEEAYTAAKHELYTGGYRVYTTIDLEKQDEMQAVLDEVLAEKDTKLDNGIYQVQGSMTVIDNSNGKVVAVIGGRSQDELKGNYTLNRAYQGFAQPGSSIKPLIVYAAAMDSGDYTPESELKNIDVGEAKEDELTVAEIAEMDGEEISLRRAIEKSLNGCAYWLFSQIGVKKGLSYIQEMGFSRIVPGDENMSSALGGLVYGVSTEEMANAYYTLENDGVYKDTDCIEAMYDRYDHDIYRDSSEKQVYSVDAAKNATSCMMGVLKRGTAASSDWYDYTDTEAAGKTGTTNDNKAGWFCGYTPYYTIAVWVGCDKPTEINGLSGSSYPLSIWQKAMLKMIEGKPAKYFDVPEDEEPETKASCNCSTRCDMEHRNEDCPVCRYDVWECKGKEATCTCTTKCDGDSLNEACPVCMQNVDDCKGQELICTCTDRCSADSINDACEFCQHDYTACKGVEHEEETDPPEETTAEQTTSEPTHEDAGDPDDVEEEPEEDHGDEGDQEDPPEPDDLEEFSEE